MAEYQEREIFAYGRYIHCQILNWQEGPPPKYLICNPLDARYREEFLAYQAMGAWAKCDLRHAIADFRALLDELSRLREVERRAKEVIQPFAIEATEHNGDYRWGWEDDRELAGSQFCDLTFGHFRAARDLYRALSERKEGQDG